MILKRILAAAAAAGAALAAAAALVVALVYALFALLRDQIGPSGAAAVVALVIAVLFGAAFAFLAMKAQGPRVRKIKHGPVDPVGAAPMDRILTLARERPVIAAGAAVAAGLLALRNPALVAVMTKMFTEPRRPPSA